MLPIHKCHGSISTRVVHTLNLALKSICAAKMTWANEEQIIFEECCHGRWGRG